MDDFGMNFLEYGRVSTKDGVWCAEGEADPIGVKVSKPFTADQGRPFFFTSSCMLRAVMSTAKAKKWAVSAPCVRVSESCAPYPAMWDSAASCDMSRPPLPITRPSSTGASPGMSD